MKIAISVPDKTFAKADALAQRLKTSRSAVFARAIEAYEVEEDAIDLTAQIDAFVDSMTGEERAEHDVWVRAGARTVLKHTGR
jgi:predicted transcriptional regulator